MSLQDSISAQYFFNTPTAYGAGASLVKTPVQARYATTRSWPTPPSAVCLRHPEQRHQLPYKWVMYDPENWTRPGRERQDRSST